MKPLDLVASMVLENGARWGECATGDQWDDMQALLQPDGGPRYHFWLRSRGRSKTFDTGAATVAVMLTDARPGDEIYAAAAGKDQAGLLAGKIRQITVNTPELAGAVEVQQTRVLTPSTGAVLDVLSSELAGSWGKTPFWVFVDEICNHDNTPPKEAFVKSLTTALPKRRDSRCLLASSPSDSAHWSYARWQHAQKSRLWRASQMTGPAPWQDPEELEDQREDLEEWEWLRLFMGQWASADDSVADEQAVTECTRDLLFLHPVAGTEYVVAWDIGWKKDHSAVCVLHLGERGGRRAIICDRLESWTPQHGREVRISDVLDRAAELSREYNGALITGDPHEAWQTIQDLREQGYLVRPADTGAAANSLRAKHLLRLVRDRNLELPPDPQLRKELLSLRLAEGTTPGVVRLTSDNSSKGHHDRVMAVMYGAEEILSRAGMSWRDFNGATRTCQACGRVTIAAAASCTFPDCRAPNPEAPPVRAAAASTLIASQPGGWFAALAPEGARRCGRGHVYAGSHGENCPDCAGRSGLGGMQVPTAFLNALAVGRR